MSYSQVASMLTFLTLAALPWGVRPERVKFFLKDHSKDRLSLVPYPAALTAHSNDKPFLLTKGAEVTVGEGIPQDDLAVTDIRTLMAEVGQEGQGAGIKLSLEPGSAKDIKEGYELYVKHTGVELKAPTVAGLFQGVQTLKQLAAPGATASAALPAVSISDAPRFGWRGLHLDVSRHFFNASSVKRLLDVMAQYKLNTFHWHLTDDQGWRLPVDGYPNLLTVGAHGQAYTKEDIHDVVAYAKARHITVIPEIDVPGHVEAALAAYPELGNDDIKGRLAPKEPRKEWGVSMYTLAPHNATWTFLNKVYDTLAELFPSQIVHIGGDEVMTREWGQSASAQSLLQSGGLRSKSGAETEKKVGKLFEAKIVDMLQKRGRKVAAWNEALQTEGFPTDGIIVAWQGEGLAQQAVRAGRKVVVANQDKLYFDHAQASRGEPANFGGCSSLAKVYAYDPMPRGLSSAEQKLVLGGQGQLWSEYIPTWEHAEYMAHPRSLALAERLWTPPESIVNFEEFHGRLWHRLSDLEKTGVNFRRLMKGGSC